MNHNELIWLLFLRGEVGLYTLQGYYDAVTITVLTFWQQFIARPLKPLLIN